MADVNGVAEVESLGQGRDIGRVRIHVVATGCLARAAMAPTVMRNDTEPLA
jgi:hypothetical protein